MSFLFFMGEKTYCFVLGCRGLRVFCPVISGPILGMGPGKLKVPSWIPEVFVYSSMHRLPSTLFITARRQKCGTIISEQEEKMRED